MNKDVWERFEGSNQCIAVPNNFTEKTVKRFSKGDLDAISKVPDLAMDKIMVFIHYLYRTVSNGNVEKYEERALYSGLLKQIYGDRYKRIIDLLVKKKIIRVNNSYRPTSKTNGLGISKQYQLTGKCQKFYMYKLKTEWGINQIDSVIGQLKVAARNNVISWNDVMMVAQRNVVLPTIEEIKLEARKLARLYAPLTPWFEKKRRDAGKKINKYKGRYCVLRKKKDEVLNTNKVRVMEENIQQFFKQLKITGEDTSTAILKIPTTNEHDDPTKVNCLRVYTSFSMMASWIRHLITIDGEKIVQNDFTALHPHIMMALYGSNHDYEQIDTDDIHSVIAAATGIEREIVKKKHLSFFNKELRDIISPERIQEIYNHQKDRTKVINWKDTIKEKIVRYYFQNHETMLLNMMNEKLNMKLQHKITSQTLFDAEVDLMKDIIKELNSRNIYTLYTYDCLYSTESEKEIVREVMNDIAYRKGYKTRVSE